MIEKHNTKSQRDHEVFGCTCSMLSDRLISPDDRVTMAFIPSGVMSILAQKKDALIYLNYLTLTYT